MNVLIDTNIVLDVLCNREPFIADSEAVLTLAAKGKIEAGITANTVTDIYYLVKKHIRNHEEVRRAMLSLMDLLDVIEVTRDDCLKAFDLPMTDYEDALLTQCAKRKKADFIVTRNTKDFENAPVTAITPEMLLAKVDEQ